VSKTYRVGIIGFGHMHINHVSQVYNEHPQVEWAACADTVPVVPEVREAPYTRAWNLKKALTDLGIPKAYDDWREMLEKEDLDIVIVTCENAQHPVVVEACAAAGVNVCVEKPMADSLSGALRMARAVQAAGTEMAINWPATWRGSSRKIKELVDDGVIGRVLEVKWRAGHTGPLGPGAAHAGVSDEAALLTGPERAATWWHQVDTGGGAMLDFCSYGAMLSRWYIGEPATAAIGLKTNLDSHWAEAEDNAAMIVRFPSAMGLFEASFTTWDHGVLTGPIVYGTTGTLVAEGSGTVRLERGHGDTTIYDPDPLPEGREEIAGEFIHHLDTGEPMHPTIEMMLNLEIMAILDAGVRSAASGKLETVDSSTWRIG
jgi:predicted dehydrogenase